MPQILAGIAGGIIFIGLGSYLWLRPADAAEKLRTFFSTYPLIRLAGEKQHTSRSAFIKVLGAVFVILGLVYFVCVLFYKVL